MPQLRSGVRRGRQPAAAALGTDENKGEAPSNKPTGPSGGKRTPVKRNNNIGSGNKDKEAVVLVDGCAEGEGGNDDVALKETASFRVGENCNRVEEVKEDVAEKKMDDGDSGGRPSEKGLGADDEGSTAPLPERVRCIKLYTIFLYLRYTDL